MRASIPPRRAVARTGLTALVALGWLCGPGFGQEILFQIHGQELGEFLAISSDAGDVNHDGVPEVLVSSSLSSKLRLYSGRTHDLILEIVGETTPGPALLSLGSSIDGAGDFDGDGTLDIVAGAPGDTSTGIDRAGSARVYSGRDGHEIARWNGNIVTGRTGLWVAGLGDITGDGYADVATTGLFDRVWILGGPDMHLIRFHDGVLTRASVAGVGDIDGDGLPDYICGWPQDSTQGLWTGRATVFSGGTGAEIFTVHGETPHGGGQTGHHLGLAVAGAGDVNADGIPDFIVGAPGEIDLTFGATHGMVRVYSGADASILWEWQAADHTISPATHFGHRVHGGHDVNGDGYDDLLLAAPSDSPVPGGTLRGSANLFSGRTGELLWKVFDPDPSFRIWFMSLIGDVDGDGLADFANGNPRVHDPEDFAGRVTIYAGARGDVDRLCPAAPNSAGPGARIETQGPIGIGNNRLTLAATGAVPGEPALFLYGPESAPLPFGDGTRCIGRPYFRLAPVLTVGPDGTVERLLDNGQQPLHQGPGRVVPGATWVFQLWYGDPQGPGATGFNLSDALRIRFLP